MRVRVAIVEDDAGCRENLAQLLEASGRCVVVAQSGSCEEALKTLPKEEVDVVLMDIRLPGRSGIDCVRELAPRARCAIVMLTNYEDSERVFEALRAGATGYLLKSQSSSNIAEAVLEVHRGGSPISPQIARYLVRTFQRPESNLETQLTTREREILDHVAQGLRSKEIGEKLGISTPTVNTHVRNIYEKLHVRSRAEAVARFWK